MAEISCPMCSRLNTEEDESCAFCGARLKPLVLDQPSQDFPIDRNEERQPTKDDEDADVPDWLMRIRAGSEKDTGEEGADDEELTGEGQGPDWLGRLRHVDMEKEEGPPEGEIPGWLSEHTEEIAETDSDEGVDELVGEGESEEEVPDWLSRIRESEEQEEEPEQVDEVWLDRLKGEPQAEISATEGVIPDLEPSMEDSPEIDLEPAEPPDEEILPGADAPIMEAVEEAEELPEPTEQGVSEGLTDAGIAWEEPSDPILEEELPEGEVIQPAPQKRDSEDDLEFAPPEEEAAELPPLDSPDVQEEDELPHVPALIYDDEDAPVESELAPDLDLDAIDLPEWLTEVGESAAKEEAVEGEASPDLAPATLPSWLEAMKPIETFRSVVEIESAEDQIVESAGPLAGLRGVLMAEPIVAMPHASSVGSTQLNVTERQYAQAELLQRIVDEEAYEQPKAPSDRIRLPILRWVISFILVLSVSLPSLLSLGIGEAFPLPSLVPRDLTPLTALVESIPPEQPVLVVFDYTPGYTGELAVVAGVLFDHMMSRDLRIATVSTWPTGPPLAENLLSSYGQNGVNYIHLGYLSGGQTAVQLFAAAPREAVPKGFMLPEDLGSRSGWQSPILEGVTRLSDFGMVAVITAGTESARTWAEQAHPWLDGTPLVMVLSAGAEPLVRPYYEALEPQVNGILTGLPAAVAYEQIIGIKDDARARWNSFGAGMIAVELILVAGGMYGAVVWLLRPKGE